MASATRDVTDGCPSLQIHEPMKKPDRRAHGVDFARRIVFGDFVEAYLRFVGHFAPAFRREVGTVTLSPLWGVIPETRMGQS